MNNFWYGLLPYIVGSVMVGTATVVFDVPFYSTLFIVFIVYFFNTKVKVTKNK